MISFLMFNISIIELFIALSVIDLFRCACVSNLWPQLVYLYPLHPHRRNIPMLGMRMTRPPYLLKESNSYSNNSMTFCKIPLLNTSSDMTNIGFHTSSRLGIRFDCICNNRGSQDLITRFFHFNMFHKPSLM